MAESEDKLAHRLGNTLWEHEITGKTVQRIRQTGKTCSPRQLTAEVGESKVYNAVRLFAPIPDTHVRYGTSA